MSVKDIDGLFIGRSAWDAKQFDKIIRAVLAAKGMQEGGNLMLKNIPDVRLGLIAVSRDCFVVSLSERRRAAIAEACRCKDLQIEEIKTTVEKEQDALKAVAEAKEAGCNALVVFLGNFGPETPETLIARHFDGPVMYAAAAEESGDDLINGRGDAYCGMLNCSLPIWGFAGFMR